MTVLKQLVHDRAPVLPSREHGFALLIVVVAIAALSLIFGAALSTARQHVASTDAALSRVTLLAAVDAAVSTSVYELASARLQRLGPAADRSNLVLGDAHVVTSIRPENAKLDLNVAPDALLKAYLSTLGLSERTVHTLVGHIVKRRADARPEDDADRSTGPGSGPFLSVNELLDIAGVDSDLFNCAAPDLTVFTRVDSVDWPHASDRLRKSIGGDPASVNDRGSVVATTLAAGEVLEITVRAEDTAAHMSASRQVVVRLTGNQRNPVWILSETAPAPDEAEVEAACSRVRPKRKSASVPK